MEAKEIKKDLYWCGVFDDKLRVFDIIMHTPYGTTYNSYLLKGSTGTVLFETAKENFWGEYSKRIDSAMALSGAKTVDYIVLNHTEPDHSGSLAQLYERFPDATIVATGPALKNLARITHRALKSIEVVPAEVDGQPSPVSVDLGNYKLRFVISPFLHWPDTMLTWIEGAKAIVTCDFFGSHYCNDKVFSDLMTDTLDSVLDAYKYYYDCIFGPFPKYVQKGLDNVAAGPPIDVICCSHGPVLRGEAHLKQFQELYRKWSTMPALEDRVVIAYVAAYGYTRKMAESIAEGVRSAGVAVDLVDMVEAGEGAVASVLEKFSRARGLLLGTPTIVGDALPPIWQVALALNPIVHQDRYVGVFGSYGWSGEGTRNIMQRVDQARCHTPLDPFDVCFKPTADDLRDATAWGMKFARAVKGDCIDERRPQRVAVKKLSFPTDGKLRRWRCVVCGEIVIAVLPPLTCAACGASQEAFVCIGVVDEANARKTDFAGHVVVVGSGAAALSAVKAIRETNDSCRVTLISRETEVPYYRPLITKLLANPAVRSDPTFYLAPEPWYASNNVRLLLSCKVTAVDTAAKHVTVQPPDGSKPYDVEYDKLILATGGNSALPLESLASARNVFSVRTVAEVDQLYSFMHKEVPGGMKAVRASIIGGGLAALETAHSLVALGARSVTVIEAMPRLLPKQLTPEGSRIFQAELTKSSVTLHTGVTVRSLQYREGDPTTVTALILSDGTVVPTDVVTFSIGTTPELSIAKYLLGIKVERALVVSDTMEVMPGVFACGDGTQFAGSYVPTWTVAIGQGRVAGLQAVGATWAEGAVYSPINTPYYMDCFLPVFSIGNISDKPGKKVTIASSNSPDLIELFFDHDKHIIGAVILGSAVSSLQAPITMAITAAALFQDVMDTVTSL